MNNRISSVMRIHLRDKTLLFLPWTIMLFSFFVNLVIGVVLTSETSIYTGGLASIYMYMFVFGCIVLPQTFQFALGLSVRRTDYFWGTTAVIVAISAVFSALLLLLGFVETDWTSGWGVDLHFFKLPYLHDGSIAAQFWVGFALFVHMFFFGFVISSVHRRFGKTGLWILTIVLLVLVSVVSYFATYYGWWMPVLLWLGAHTAVQLAWWLLAITVAFALISYALLRRATV